MAYVHVAPSLVIAASPNSVLSGEPHPGLVIVLMSCPRNTNDALPWPLSEGTRDL